MHNNTQKMRIFLTFFEVTLKCATIAQEEEERLLYVPPIYVNQE